ncbi:MAG: hypothetical protein EB072_02820 [Betaproteobacteria bacterium]|nr:hypothetical protein [Betaproteobacteria bacterium]
MPPQSGDHSAIHAVDHNVGEDLLCSLNGILFVGGSRGAFEGSAILKVTNLPVGTGFHEIQHQFPGIAINVGDRTSYGQGVVALRLPRSRGRAGPAEEKFQCIHPRSLRPAGQGCQPVSERSVRALGTPNLFISPDLYSFYCRVIWVVLSGHPCRLPCRI